MVWLINFVFLKGSLVVTAEVRSDGGGGGGGGGQKKPLSK